MNNDEKDKPAENTVGHDKKNPFVVSQVIIDEKTGTVTLKLASEEEIAKANNSEQ